MNQKTVKARIVNGITVYEARINDTVITIPRNEVIPPIRNDAVFIK